MMVPDAERFLSDLDWTIDGHWKPFGPVYIPRNVPKDIPKKRRKRYERQKIRWEMRLVWRGRLSEGLAKLLTKKEVVFSWKDCPYEGITFRGGLVSEDEEGSHELVAEVESELAAVLGTM